MCGIIGYAGPKQAAPILLEGLQRLEYRGYDSAGICVHGNGLQVEKSKGRLKVLKEKCKGGESLPGTVGIGHTRWATHGAPSDVNSHPHLSGNGKVAVVHNGIIENQTKWRAWLEERGQHFSSQTDTEVVANLIGWRYAACGDLMAAVQWAVQRLEGSFALGILCADMPDTVMAVKKDSPLVFGWGEEEQFIASDVSAILKHTRTVSFLEDGDMVVFDGRTARFFDSFGEKAARKREQIQWEVTAAERGGYDHFMLKEIFEQPKAVRDTVKHHLEGESPLRELHGENVRRIWFVACGSAYYVSLFAKYTLEQLCRVPAEAMVASEFRYCQPLVDERDLVVIISQSGETADSLAALREAKRRGAQTLAVVNVVGSAIAKAADRVLYTLAGPEIAVATTKAFSAQLAAVCLLALQLGVGSESGQIMEDLKKLPDVMECVLQACQKPCQYLADRFCGHHDVFFVGRNRDSALCMEGSLKLKEVAYLHSEAYPAGELKHGPISMIEKGTLVVALATVDALFDKTMAAVAEVKARGADVLCITTEERHSAAKLAADHVLTLPKIHPLLQGSLALLPLQLFAYYVAVERGCDVDKPRNLAKSVTVE